jgi:hypothetical protein
LAYLIEQGPTEQTLLKQALRLGEPIPDKIANAPELRLGLQLFIDAFFDLDSERTHGDNLALIPWRSIREYALAFDFDEEQTADLFYFVRKMDSDHLKRLAAKRKANVGKPARPSKAT